MQLYKTLVREFLASYAEAIRKNRHLTQEVMAEQLRITSRAYGDLERGKYCFSSATLLFFLAVLSESELKEFTEEFQKRVYLLEHQDVA